MANAVKTGKHVAELMRRVAAGETVTAVIQQMQEDLAAEERLDLSKVDLRGADLRDANLVNAILMGAELRNASMHRARLGGADLRRADLQKASMFGVDLTDAVVMRMRVAGADMYKVVMSIAQAQQLPHQDLKSVTRAPPACHTACIIQALRDVKKEH